MTQTFFGQESFLNHTLAFSKLNRDELKNALTGKGDKINLSHTHIHLLDLGIIEIVPNKITSGPIILSAGIHGNETGPIEWLNQLVIDILSEHFIPTCPLLLILGNPNAIAVQERFVKDNLNRLFCGHWANAPSNSTEALRAERLELAVKQFCSRHPGHLLHLDLHTAIRQSFREKFAVFPFVKDRQLPFEIGNLMVACGVATVLTMHKHGNTFSSFTSNRMNAISLTVELGRVAKFGQNDPQNLFHFDHIIRQLLQGLWPGEQAQAVEQFFVHQEIIHTGDGFELAIDEEGWNFTSYLPNTPVWYEQGLPKGQASFEQWLVFPNQNLAKGQRAGLLIRK